MCVKYGLYVCNCIITCVGKVYKCLLVQLADSKSDAHKLFIEEKERDVARSQHTDFGNSSSSITPTLISLSVIRSLLVMSLW